MTATDAPDEPTHVQVRRPSAAPASDMGGPAMAAAADLVSIATLDGAEEARAWFNERLGAFASAWSYDQAEGPVDAVMGLQRADIPGGSLPE